MPHLLFNGCVQFVKQVSSAASLACLTQSPYPPFVLLTFGADVVGRWGLKKLSWSAHSRRLVNVLLVECRFGGERFLNPQGICTKRGRGRSACVRSGICPL